MKRLQVVFTEKSSKWIDVKEKMLIPTIVILVITKKETTYVRLKFIWWHFFWKISMFFK